MTKLSLGSWAVQIHTLKWHATTFVTIRILLFHSKTVLLRGYAADTPCICGGQALEWLFSVSSSSVTNSGAFVNNEVQDVFLVCRHGFSCGWHLC